MKDDVSMNMNTVQRKIKDHMELAQYHGDSEIVSRGSPAKLGFNNPTAY